MQRAYNQATIAMHALYIEVVPTFPFQFLPFGTHKIDLHALRSVSACDNLGGHDDIALRLRALPTDAPVCEDIAEKGLI